MKKKQLSIAAIVLAGALTLGAAAAGVQTITAALRPDIKVVVNGVEQKTMTDVTGKQVYPLSYEGTVYLPIRALGDVLSHDAKWNGDTQTITLTAKERLPAYTDTAGAETAITTLENEVSALKPAATYEERAKQYAVYSAKLSDFSDDLSRVYAQVSDDFNMGRVTYETYRGLVLRLDRVADRQKAALAALEKKTIADTSGYQTAYERSLALLNELDTAVKAAEAKVNDLKSGATYTERVKQYNALNKELAPLRERLADIFDDVNDDLKENRLTYTQYSALTTKADDLDARLKTARANLERKTISIIDDQPQQPSGSANYKSYADQVADLNTRCDKEVKNVYNYKPAQGASNNKQAYRQLDAKLDALDKEIDRLDDAIERAYKSGKLTAAEYRGLEQTLDRAEDKLDNASDHLEDVLDYDDDRYDDDDDYDDRYDD